jgi:hypothetical protein
MSNEKRALRVLWPVLIAGALAVSSNAASIRRSCTNRQKEGKTDPAIVKEKGETG